MLPPRGELAAFQGLELAQKLARIHSPSTAHDMIVLLCLEFASGSLFWGGSASPRDALPESEGIPHLNVR
jgi:hypothetical protein